MLPLPWLPVPASARGCWVKTRVQHPCPAARCRGREEGLGLAWPRCGEDEASGTGRDCAAAAGAVSACCQAPRRDAPAPGEGQAAAPVLRDGGPVLGAALSLVPFESAAFRQPQWLPDPPFCPGLPPPALGSCPHSPAHRSGCGCRVPGISIPGIPVPWCPWCPWHSPSLVSPPLLSLSLVSPSCCPCPWCPCPWCPRPHRAVCEQDPCRGGSGSGLSRLRVPVGEG